MRQRFLLGWRPEFLVSPSHVDELVPCLKAVLSLGHILEQLENDSLHHRTVSPLGLRSLLPSLRPRLSLP
jgi:hypothetical protein